MRGGYVKGKKSHRAESPMKVLVFLFPIALFLTFLSIKILLPGTYALLIQEDSVIEYAQACLYGVSSVMSFFLSIKFLKNRLTLHGVLYGMLAVGLLFVSLEEISWGQRIFDFANGPYFERHNVQHEVSFHNLDAIQPLLIKTYVLTGAYGAFAWLFVELFASKGRKNDHILNFIVPDWYMSPYFFFVFLVYVLFDRFMRPSPSSFLQWRDQEPVELLLSMGFLSFVIAGYIRLRTCLKSASRRTV
jgi:hypothetical protein